jgi:predicted DCC family thiol-disulfide oxidoreductase YuxK
MTKAVLVFDGDCSFCTSVAFHLESNSVNNFDVVAWQLTDLSKFKLTTAQTAKKVYLLVDGKNYSGAKAVAKSLTFMKPRIYRALGYLLLVPPFSWMAIPGYSLVARFRHRLPGGTPACKL